MSDHKGGEFARVEDNGTDHRYKARFSVFVSDHLILQTSSHCRAKNMANVINIVFSERVRPLVGALDIGVNWMSWWIDKTECYCEDVHRCGKTQKLAELEKMKKALEDFK